MSITDQVDELQKNAMSPRIKEQIDEQNRAIAKMERQGYAIPEPDGYRIPLDEKLAMSCQVK